MHLPGVTDSSSMTMCKPVRQTDRRTDGRTDGQTDKRVNQCVKQTDRQTDGKTDRQTCKPVRNRETKRAMFDVYLTCDVISNTSSSSASAAAATALLNGVSSSPRVRSVTTTCEVRHVHVCGERIRQ